MTNTPNMPPMTPKVREALLQYMASSGYALSEINEQRLHNKLLYLYHQAIATDAIREALVGPEKPAEPVADGAPDVDELAELIRDQFFLVDIDHSKWSLLTEQSREDLRDAARAVIKYFKDKSVVAPAGDLVSTAVAVCKAMNQLCDKYAEGDDNVKQNLWRAAHEANQALFTILDREGLYHKSTKPPQTDGTTRDRIALAICNAYRETMVPPPPPLTMSDFLDSHKRGYSNKIIYKETDAALSVVFGELKQLMDERDRARQLCLQLELEKTDVIANVVRLTRERDAALSELAAHHAAATQSVKLEDKCDGEGTHNGS